MSKPSYVVRNLDPRKLVFPKGWEPDDDTLTRVRQSVALVGRVPGKTCPIVDADWNIIDGKHSARVAIEDGETAVPCAVASDQVDRLDIQIAFDVGRKGIDPLTLAAWAKKHAPAAKAASLANLRKGSEKPEKSPNPTNVGIGTAKALAGQAGIGEKTAEKRLERAKKKARAAVDAKPATGPADSEGQPLSESAWKSYRLLREPLGRIDARLQRAQAELDAAIREWEGDAKEQVPGAKGSLLGEVNGAAAQVLANLGGIDAAMGKVRKLREEVHQVGHTVREGRPGYRCPECKGHPVLQPTCGQCHGQGYVGAGVMRNTPDILKVNGDDARVYDRRADGKKAEIRLYAEVTR